MTNAEFHAIIILWCVLAAAVAADWVQGMFLAAQGCAPSIIETVAN
jgi:hypothetical protein